MPEYVTREEWQNHLDEAESERIARLEEEVMGNQESGRPSLRAELVGKMKRQTALTFWMGTTIVGLLIANLLR